MFFKTLFASLVFIGSIAVSAVPITFSDEVDFLSSTGSISLESFESEVATNNRALPSLALSDFTMTMNAGATLGIFDTDFFGGHATDGTNYVGFSDGHDFVDFDFNLGINAFGITFTDFGDFGNGTITFSNDNGDMFVAAISGGANANEQFFGIITDFNFTMVTLSQSIAGEFYAADEVYYGTTAIPEPTSLAILLLGLLGLNRLRRK